MKIQVSKILEFDDEKEEARLRRLFTGNTLKRQIELLNHFRAHDFDSFQRAFNRLPYNKTDHCSEKEYVCEFMVDFVWDYVLGGFEVKSA